MPPPKKRSAVRARAKILAQWRGVDYAPLAFPGFSWKNMNGPKANTIPRERGNFFWKQVAGAKNAGAEMLYVAMFDEMNEGTSIFKCATTDHLPLNGDGSFTGIDADLGSDYYLWLTGQAARGRQCAPMTDVGSQSVRLCAACPDSESDSGSR